jgi:hypothetical protein
MEGVVRYEAVKLLCGYGVRTHKFNVFKNYLSTSEVGVDCGGNMKVNGVGNVGFRRWSWPTCN